MDIGIKLSDKTLQELDLVLSGIINSESVGELCTSLLTIVEPEECEGFYYIFLKYIERAVKMKSITHSRIICVNEMLFKRFLNTNIIRFLEDDNVNFKGILDELMITSPDTQIEEGRKKEQQLLYSYCLKKFKLIQATNVSEYEGVFLLDNLYESIVNDYCINSVRLGSMVLNSPVKFGKEVYEGSEGYINITRLSLGKVLQKKSFWDGMTNSIIALDSLENYNRIMERNKFRMRNICKMGFKPIDDFATLTTGDIVNLTATEGTGKTTYCCALTARELMAGYNVIYMCGETVESVIVNMVLSHFIYLTTEYEIHWKEIAYIYHQLTDDMLEEDEDMEDFEGIPEEYYAIVNDAKYKLYTTPEYGKLIPIPVFTYNNFKQEAIDIIDAYPESKFGHIMIDHTDALVIDNTSGNKYIKDRHHGVGELFKDIVAVKRERGVPTFTTSHTSFEAEKKIVKGDETGTRVGATNSGTSKDVDIVLTFESTPVLKRQGLIKVVVKKYRSVSDTLFVPFIVKKDFTACRFIYTLELQEILGVKKEKEINTADIGLIETDSEDLIGE